MVEKKMLTGMEHLLEWKKKSQTQRVGWKKYWLNGNTGLIKWIEKKVIEPHLIEWKKIEWIYTWLVDWRNFRDWKKIDKNTWMKKKVIDWKNW